MRYARVAMSHATIEYSPAGTPILERTVGELVAERPSRSRVFQKYGIDFCCQGGRTLAEACQRKEVDATLVVGDLEADNCEESDVSNPAELPPRELIDHIVTKHHGFLNQELPRLHAMAERVAKVHGPHTPSLVELHLVYEEMMIELTHHMSKEEQVLFPAIEAMVDGRAVNIPLDGAISAMLAEHDDAGAALARMRQLTHGYTPPPEACNTYRALFAGLAELEEDLHRHIHLENSVLFPAARRMAGI